MKKSKNLFTLDYYGCLDTDAPLLITRFLNLLFGPLSNGEDVESMRRRCLLSMNAFLMAVVHLSNIDYFTSDANCMYLFIAYQIIFWICYIASRTSLHFCGICCYIGFAMVCPYITGGFLIASGDSDIAALFLKWIVFPLLSLAYVARPKVVCLLTAVHVLLLVLIQYTGTVDFNRAFSQFYYTVALCLMIVCSQLLYRKMVLELINTRELFISNISHELRTPLNGIVASLEALLSSPLNSQQTSTLKLAQFSSETLLHVVNDLLEFARCKNSQTEIMKTNFDLVQCVHSVVQSFTVLAVKKNVTLEAQLPQTLPARVHGDQHRVVQVLTNYLSNALKFSRDTKVFVRLSVDGGHYKLEVQDFGPGIPKEKVSLLFRPFSRLSPHQSQGTGLGLFICSELSAAMGGDCGVESELGKGSTFWFTFPREEAVRDMTDITDHDVPHVSDDDLSNPDSPSPQRPERVHTLQHIPIIVPATAHRAAEIELVVVNPSLSRTLSASNPEICKSLSPSSSTGDRKDSQSSASKTSLKHKSQDDSDINGRLGSSSSVHFNYSNDFKATSSSFPNGTCVLVAEDNPFNQQVAEMLLRSANSSCYLCNNGRECLDAYERDPGQFSMILMDCQMPVMDGQTATREIRRLEKDRNWSPIPIVGLTADAREGNLKSCLSAGMQTALIKPIRSRVLLDACLPLILKSQRQRPGIALAQSPSEQPPAPSSVVLPMPPSLPSSILPEPPCIPLAVSHTPPIAEVNSSAASCDVDDDEMLKSQAAEFTIVVNDTHSGE
eukprot:GILK01002173.1.p1 GENE.GILK01002173.1~~GILK01002173.1.p1  ORF type:complete len:780 (+),score=103.57 GILK01002173.1:211-2550(+)